MERKNILKVIGVAVVVILLTVGYVAWKESFGDKEKRVVLENNSATGEIDVANDAKKVEEVPVVVEKTPEVVVEKTVAPDVEKKPAPVVEKPAEEKVTDKSLRITDRLMSAGFQEAAGRTIDTIILHSSYDALGSDPFSISGIIKEYEDYGVSAHYLIGRDGRAYRLVKEKNIAYHAGVSQVPDGRTNVNSFSIGIELVATKTSGMTNEQYAAVQQLIEQIKVDYKIKYVLGHDQIAPGRKDDPWKFEWKKLK